VRGVSTWQIRLDRDDGRPGVRFCRLTDLSVSGRFDRLTTTTCPYVNGVPTGIGAEMLSWTPSQWSRISIDPAPLTHSFEKNDAYWTPFPITSTSKLTYPPF
jgi:hypothetical protein